MATIKRAKGYFSYLIALAITGVFSLFGKPAPGWAEEAAASHSAKVFQETLQGKKFAQATVPQNPVGTKGWLTAEHANPAGTKGWLTAEHATNPMGTRGWLTAEHASPLTGNYTVTVQQQYTDRKNIVFKDIEAKLATNAALTDQELLYLKLQESDRAVTDLKKQVTDLSVQIETLTKMLKDKGL